MDTGENIGSPTSSESLRMREAQEYVEEEMRQADLGGVLAGPLEGTGRHDDEDEDLRGAVDMAPPVTRFEPGSLIPPTHSEEDMARIRRETESFLSDVRCVVVKGDGPSRSYDAVREIRSKLYKIETVNGRKVWIFNNGTFFNGDDRITQVRRLIDSVKHQYITLSFNEVTMSCLSCTGRDHFIRSADRPVFLLGDQGVPPLIPTKDHNGCIFVLRIEDGRPGELVDLLMSVVGPVLPLDSYIIISCGSMLSRVGLCSYLVDLVAAVNIAKRHWPEARINHGPILVNEGGEKPVWAGAVANLMTWLVNQSVKFPGEFSLEETYRLTNRELFFDLAGTANGRSVTVLPTSLTDKSVEPVVIGGHHIKNSLVKTDEETEKKILTQNIRELIQRGARLSTNIDCSRQRTDDAIRDDRPGIIFLGGENAAKLRNVAVNLGRHAHLVSLPSLKKSDIESAVDQMKELYQNVEDKANVTLVCLVFNERAFISVGDDGTASVPTRDENGNSHIEGDLAIIGDDQIRLICDKVSPVIREAPDLFKIHVGPMPKFICQPCCDDEGHMTNRGRPDFTDNMMRGIANIKNIGRRQFHNNGILKAQMINVAPLLKDHMTAAAHERDGESDRQEPTNRGYEILLAEVEDVAAGLRTTAALATVGLTSESPSQITARVPRRPQAAEIAPADVVLPPQQRQRQEQRGGIRPESSDRSRQNTRPAPSPSPPATRNRRRSGSRAAENRVSPYERPQQTSDSGFRPIPGRRPSDTGSSGSSAGTLQGVYFTRPDQRQWREDSRERRRHVSEGAAYQPRYAPQPQPQPQPQSYSGSGQPLQPPQMNYDYRQQPRYERPGPHHEQPLQHHEQPRYEQPHQRQVPPPPPQQSRGYPQRRNPYERPPSGVWVDDPDSRYDSYGYDFSYPRYGGDDAPYEDPRQ